MRIGTLHVPCRVTKPIRATTPGGSFEERFETVLERLFVEITPMAGSESMQADVRTSSLRAKGTCRYFDGLAPKFQLETTTQVWRILSCVDSGRGRRREMLLELEAIDAKTGKP